MSSLLFERNSLAPAERAELLCWLIGVPVQAVIEYVGLTHLFKPLLLVNLATNSTCGGSLMPPELLVSDTYPSPVAQPAADPRRNAIGLQVCIKGQAPEHCAGLGSASCNNSGAVPLCTLSHVLQVGFLLRIEGNRLSAALEDCLPDFEEAFESSGPEIEGTYYRTSRTQQLDARFGDMLNNIQDLEVSCLWLVPRAVLCAHAWFNVDPSLTTLRTQSFMTGMVCCANGRPTLGFMLAAKQDLNSCGLSLSVPCIVCMHSRAVDRQGVKAHDGHAACTICCWCRPPGHAPSGVGVLSGSWQCTTFADALAAAAYSFSDSTSCLCRAVSAWGCFSSIHAEMVQSSSSQGETCPTHTSSCTGQVQCLA